MPDVDILLADVKGYLHITWEDENTNKNLTGMIKRGMARLQNIAGVSLDFMEENLPRSLLFDYCRYANSHAIEMFEKNFASELLELHLSNQFAVPEKLAIVSIAGASTGYTKINVSPQLDNGDSYMYKLDTELSLPGYFDICDIAIGYIKWNGVDEIQASAGSEILVVEVDENHKAIRAGKITVTVR